MTVNLAAEFDLAYRNRTQDRRLHLVGALAAYERLTPDLLKAVGGDRFPPAPIHEVRRVP